jgi:FkbM family methyltransferase
MGDGRRLGGGVSRRHGRCHLTRKHRSQKPKICQKHRRQRVGSVNELTDGTVRSVDAVMRGGMAPYLDSRLFGTPKHEDLIYDVGMHKGEDTEFYLRKGFRVIAFEADPDLVRTCRHRLKEYIAQGRLTIVEGAILDLDAIGAGQRTVQFYRNDNVSVWGTVRVNWAERNARLGTSSRLIQVDAVDFVGVIHEHGVPHFMKIDIEGCDMVCIKALRSFSERPDYVSIESDKTSFANIKREIDALTDLGYDCFQAIEQSAIPLSQSPPYPPTEGEYVAQRFAEGSSGLFGSELGEKWRSKDEILRQYRAVRLGYYLLGDEGTMKQWRFRGAWRLRWLTCSLLSLLTKAAVPGWYDTHARHSSADSKL